MGGAVGPSQLRQRLSATASCYPPPTLPPSLPPLSPWTPQATFTSPGCASTCSRGGWSSSQPFPLLPSHASRRCERRCHRPAFRGPASGTPLRCLQAAWHPSPVPRVCLQRLHPSTAWLKSRVQCVL